MRPQDSNMAHATDQSREEQIDFRFLRAGSPVVLLVCDVGRLCEGSEI